MTRPGLALTTVARLLLGSTAFAQTDSRLFTFTDTTTIEPDEAAPGPVDILLPSVRSTPPQDIRRVRADSPATGRFGTEAAATTGGGPQS